MEKKPMFYGGKVGPWIPVLLMLAGMLASTDHRRRRTEPSDRHLVFRDFRRLPALQG